MKSPQPVSTRIIASNTTTSTTTTTTTTNSARPTMRQFLIISTFLIIILSAHQAWAWCPLPPPPTTTVRQTQTRQRRTKANHLHRLTASSKSTNSDPPQKGENRTRTVYPSIFDTSSSIASSRDDDLLAKQDPENNSNSKNSKNHKEQSAEELEAAVIRLTEDMERQYQQLARELNLDADRIMDRAETDTRTALSDLDVALWNFIQAYTRLFNNENRLWIAQERKLETQIQELSITVLLAYSQLEEGMNRFQNMAVLPPSTKDVRQILEQGEEAAVLRRQLAQQQSFVNFVQTRVQENLQLLKEVPTPLDPLRTSNKSLQITSQRALDMVLHFGTELVQVMEDNKANSPNAFPKAQKLLHQQQMQDIFHGTLLGGNEDKNKQAPITTNTMEQLLSLNASDSSTSNKNHDNDTIPELEQAILHLKEDLLESIHTDQTLGLSEAELVAMIMSDRRTPAKSTLMDLSSLKYQGQRPTAAEGSTLTTTSSSSSSSSMDQQHDDNNATTTSLQNMIQSMNESLWLKAMPLAREEAAIAVAKRYEERLQQQQQQQPQQQNSANKQPTSNTADATSIIKENAQSRKGGHKLNTTLLANAMVSTETPKSATSSLSKTKSTIASSTTKATGTADTSRTTTTNKGKNKKKAKPKPKPQKPPSIWSKLNIPSKRPPPQWPKEDWSSSQDNNKQKTTTTDAKNRMESPTEQRKRIYWSSLIKDLDAVEATVVPQEALIYYRKDNNNNKDMENNNHQDKLADQKGRQWLKD